MRYAISTYINIYENKFIKIMIKLKCNIFITKRSRMYLLLIMSCDSILYSDSLIDAHHLKFAS